MQTGLLLAWAMPVLASLTVWQWLFDTQYGVVNWLLTQLGLDYEGHSWLLEPLSFFFVATVIVVWMSVPFVAFTGVRRAHPGPRGPGRGGRDRRRRRLAAAALRRAARRSGRCCWSSGCSR